MRGIFKAAAVVLSLISQSSDAHSVKRNALNYLSRLDNPIIHTASNRVHAYSSFELTFLLHNEQDKVRITLEPNHDVLSDSATVQYIGADGSVREERLDRMEHRVFKGHAFVQHPDHLEWINSGWARITVHRDGPMPLFEGTFRINGNHHHIQTSSNYRQTQHEDDPSAHSAEDEYMVVWRDSDIKQNPYDMSELRRGLNENSCSSDTLEFNNEDQHPVRRGLDLSDLSAVDSTRLFGRQIDGTTGNNGAGVNLAQSIGSTQGCPTTRKVALVGMATDCTYTAQFNNNSDVRINIIQLVNSASAIYESSFNISLGIQNLAIMEKNCPGTATQSEPWNVQCGNGVTITNRLNLFSAWRNQRNDTNAYWTLLSTCNTDAAVGLAWLGQLCSQSTNSNGGNETIAGANVVVRTSTEWQVFAHESGHTFGAVHDCTSDTCADGTSSMQKCCPLSTSSCNANGGFIMNPSTSPVITQFSPCTIGNICSAMGRNSVRSTCLSNNQNVVTITGSQCGNGIVESGEQCDCGGTSGCGSNSCCDPTTCKFKDNAVCDPANEDCCSSQCQFKSSGSVCRASSGSCDPQETCSGTSGACPSDVRAPDGQSCGSGLTCASGQCTSRDQQCASLVGSVTNNNNTKACDSQTCQVRCSSSELGPNACYDMAQNFLDGTPCEGGGRCSNGNCVGSSFVDQVGSFFADNKNIIIPVAASVGGLILLGLSCCILTSCRRRARRRKIAKTVQPSSSWVGGNSAPFAAAAVTRPPLAARSVGSQRSRQQPWQDEPQWGQRVPTMRYA
ncbi:zinc metalloprotease mde10 [Annulohypoxylon maeteangense]|uniref:zinc metalloprotease mde10 n=1 Tax=Annulohypoxylon maeteangense TaxID=1927788 RepID=UPI002007ADFF|nr:zinc metalloprotease mde10 [Annulohypoxylon maeteangense]KAI0885340.1 zinc metalloprotease mde10 [Annulohypoxylon maeteangense]